MRTFALGSVMILASLVWLVVAGAWGESPLEYATHSPSYQVGQNLNTVLFHLFLMISSAVFGAGLALRLSQGQRNSKKDS